MVLQEPLTNDHGEMSKENTLMNGHQEESSASESFKRLEEENSKLERDHRIQSEKLQQLKSKVEKIDMDVIQIEADNGLQQKKVDKTRQETEDLKAAMKSHLSFLEEFIDESVSTCVESMKGSDEILHMLEEIDSYDARLKLILDPNTAFFGSQGSQTCQEIEANDVFQKKRDQMFKEMSKLQYKVHVRQARIGHLEEKLGIKAEGEKLDTSRIKREKDVKPFIKPDPDGLKLSDDEEDDVKVKIKREPKYEDESDEEEDDLHDDEDEEEDEEVPQKRIRIKDEPVSDDLTDGEDEDSD